MEEHAKEQNLSLYKSSVFTYFPQLKHLVYIISLLSGTVLVYNKKIFLVNKELGYYADIIKEVTDFYWSFLEIDYGVIGKLN